MVGSDLTYLGAPALFCSAREALQCRGLGWLLYLFATWNSNFDHSYLLCTLRFTNKKKKIKNFFHIVCWNALYEFQIFKEVFNVWKALNKTEIWRNQQRCRLYVYIFWEFRYLEKNDPSWGKIQKKKVTAVFPFWKWSFREIDEVYHNTNTVKGAELMSLHPGNLKKWPQKTP